MMNHGEVQFDLELFAQLVMEGRNKLSASIVNNRRWRAVVHPNVSEEHFCYLGCFHTLARNQVSILHKSIDYYHDVFVAFRLGEVYNKVDRDVLPPALRNW